MANDLIFRGGDPEIFREITILKIFEKSHENKRKKI